MWVVFANGTTNGDAQTTITYPITFNQVFCPVVCLYCDAYLWFNNPGASQIWLRAIRLNSMDVCNDYGTGLAYYVIFGT